MKIVITDAKTVTKGDIDLSLLSNLGELTVYELTPQELLIERIKDADAVLCNKTLITRQAISSAKKLKYIGLFATGYNNIDIDAAKEYGVTVCNAGSYSTNSVAQEVFAFILNHASRVAEYNNFVSQGSWIKSETFSPFVFDMQELYGKTLGIFGFGSIGKAVAKIANAFGMNVIVSTRTVHPEDEKKHSVTFVDFDTLLAKSDFLTLHTPLTEKTKELFGRSAFDKMKTGCYFINTSRGGVIDETALAEAVRSGKLSGAAIDVLTKEPMPSDCPLYGVENITITPHIAWAPYETRQRLMSIVYNNLKSFTEGNPTNKII